MEDALAAAVARERPVALARLRELRAHGVLAAEEFAADLRELGLLDEADADE